MKGFAKGLFLVVLAVAPACLAQDFNRFEFYGGYARSQVKSTVSSVAFSTPDGGSGGYTDLCSSTTGEMLGPNSQQFFCKGRGFDGFDLSGTYNVNRYVGIKGNVTGSWRDEQFVDDFGGITQTIAVREKLFGVLAGVQLKDNSTSGGRVRPFAHALAGIARYTGRQRQTIDAFPEFNFLAEDRDTSLAIKIGGGIDVQLTPRVDLRVIEVDYNPIYAGDRGMKSISGPFAFHLTGRTAQNYTVGFGIVVH